MNPAESDEILEALGRLGLIDPGARPVLEPLTGGVSSDIYRVEAKDGPICVKRARPQLKVAARWEVTVERNRFEYEWLEVVGGIVPTAVPELFGRDETAGLFAMSYLDPAEFPVWKDQLLAGRADAHVASQVGTAVGRIHASTADSVDLASRFATDELFRDLRLDPYLTATARAHPDLADRIMGLGETTASTRRVLVHGDVSPKNVLVGPDGPVLLDAECAWFGDPAFDLAFCLNHLVLKSFHLPAGRDGYVECYNALSEAYLDLVTWEDSVAVESRAARLLPALLLARVDGVSPVEYLDEDTRGEVRSTARRLLVDGGDSLASITDSIESKVQHE